MDKRSCISNPEALLWSVCVNDDTKAFEAFFGLFYPTLLMYAKRYINETATCEDIVQDLFAWLWGNRKNLSDIHSIRSFLIISVRNRCLNYLKSKNCTSNHIESLIITRSSESLHEEGVYLLYELYGMLEKALAKLPESYRIIFEMSCLDGERYSEIAGRLGISVRTIKRYKKRMIGVLKDELREQTDENYLKREK